MNIKDFFDFMESLTMIIVNLIIIIQFINSLKKIAHI